jgi:hypothetical protein
MVARQIVDSMPREEVLAELRRPHDVDTTIECSREGCVESALIGVVLAEPRSPP